MIYNVEVGNRGLVVVFDKPSFDRVSCCVRRKQKIAGTRVVRNVIADATEVVELHSAELGHDQGLRVVDKDDVRLRVSEQLLELHLCCGGAEAAAVVTAGWGVNTEDGCAVGECRALFEE